MPTQLKPIGALFEKLMKKPRPPPAKKNATTANETSGEGNSTTTSDDEPITVKVNVQTEEDSGESAKKTESSDKEDL